MSKAVLFGLSNSKELASAIDKRSSLVALGKATIKNFADGEIFVQVDTSVRNQQVFVIQSTQQPVNESLMELLLFLDALKRASAKEINVIIPYFGYARQDRKVKGRQSISAKLVATMIELAGATRVITFDIHSEQAQGFFDIPVDILRASEIITSEVRKLNIKNLTVVSPDHGGVVRARRFAAQLDNAPLAIVDKRRIKHNEAESIAILGDVKDRNVIIYDDMIDTGGTITAAVALLKKEGAKDVYVATTHAVLSTMDNVPALEKILKAGVKKIITTNTISRKYSKDFIVIDLAEPITGVIEAHLNNDSITDYFINHYSSPD